MSISRIRALMCSTPTGAEVWRNRRAEVLARTIAMSRLYPHNAMLLTVIEEITADIGWPRDEWLHRKVETAKTEHIESLRAAGVETAHLERRAA